MSGLGELGNIAGTLSDPGDFFGARGARDAAAAQIEAAEASQAELRRQFDVQQENLRPFRELTLPALEKISAFTGASGVEAQEEAFREFRGSPGQQFLRDRAERSLLRNASAIGGLGGGNIRKALQEQAVGLAQQDFSTQFNRLAGLAGIAQTTTAQQGQLGQQFAGDISSTLTQAANARAAGQQAQQQATSNLVGTAAGLAGTFFSDKRLKENIEQIDELENGLSWYSWNWTNAAKEIVGDQRSEGVMADEVKEMFPEAVSMKQGYLVVNYGEII